MALLGWKLVTCRPVEFNIRLGTGKASGFSFHLSARSALLWSVFDFAHQPFLALRKGFPKAEQAGCVHIKRDGFGLVQHLVLPQRDHSGQGSTATRSANL